MMMIIAGGRIVMMMIIAGGRDDDGECDAVTDDDDFGGPDGNVTLVMIKMTMKIHTTVMLIVLTDAIKQIAN